MGIALEIATFFERLSVQINTWAENRAWKELLRDELDTFSDEDQPVVRALLQNQIHHNRETAHNQHVSFTSQQQLVKTTSLVCRELLPLRNIVGIQPMQGPVGLVYHMDVVDSKENWMKLEILKHAISASSHQLSARWTVEAMQDAKVLHNMDLESEITRLLASSVATDYFVDVVETLQRAGRHTSASLEFVGNDSKADEFVKRLIQRISAEANKIATATQRGRGNFVILPASLGFVFERVADRVKDFKLSDENAFESQNHLQMIGTIHGAIKVYVDRTRLFYNDLEVVVGYHGSATDTGYILAPYIPLISRGITIHPETFEPTMSFLTRGSDKLITKSDNPNASEYYSTIKVSYNFDPVEENVAQSDLFE